MVVPGTLGAQDSQLEVGVHSRDRDVKAVNFVTCAVGVGHGIDGGLQPFVLMVRGVSGHTQIQVDDLLGLQADVHRHFAVFHGQGALAIAGFVDVEHAAVGVKVCGVDVVRQGSLGGGGFALALTFSRGGLNGGDRLAAAPAGSGGFGCAAACQQQGSGQGQGYDLELFHVYFPTLFY